MASANITLTDSMRISSFNASAYNLATLSYVSTFQVSTVFTQEFVLSTTTISDLVLSLAQYSNFQVFQMVATDVVRVNFGNILGGASYVSNASAGLPVHFLAFAGSNISGPINVHFSYSGSTSSTIRIMIAQ